MMMMLMTNQENWTGEATKKLMKNLGAWCENCWRNLTSPTVAYSSNIYSASSHYVVLQHCTKLFLVD